RPPEKPEDNMKYIALLTVVAAAAIGAGFVFYPHEFRQYADASGKFAARVWGGIEANPGPVIIRVGTFLLTVLYYKAKGKSLPESLAVAATRVTVVTTPPENPDETPVVRRAKARATRAQLITDRIGLQNRHKKLPEEIVKAEKEACYTEQAVGEAEQGLTEK